MKADQVSDRSIVTGDVEHCIEVLKRCEEGGISEVILYFNFGELEPPGHPRNRWSGSRARSCRTSPSAPTTIPVGR